MLAKVLLAVLAAHVHAFVAAPIRPSSTSRARPVVAVASWYDTGMRLTADALTPEQEAALLEASMSKGDVRYEKADGTKYQKENAFTRPVMFASCLRNPSDAPTADDWNAVRASFPALAGCDDASLMRAIGPLVQKNPIDFRFL